jgi:hypothetical protein
MQAGCFAYSLPVGMYMHLCFGGRAPVTLCPRLVVPGTVEDPGCGAIRTKCASLALCSAGHAGSVRALAVCGLYVCLAIIAMMAGSMSTNSSTHLCSCMHA